MKQGCFLTIILAFLCIGFFLISFYAWLDLLSLIGLVIPSSFYLPWFGQIKVLILYFSTLAFFLASWGVSIAKKMLKISIIITSALLFTDFFFSLTDLAPFGDTIELISWLFLCSLIWLGLLQWAPPPETHDEIPLKSAYDYYRERIPAIMGIILYIFICSSAALFLIGDTISAWNRADIVKMILLFNLFPLLPMLAHSSYAEGSLEISHQGQEAECSQLPIHLNKNEWADSTNEIIIVIPSTLKTMGNLIGIACLILLLGLSRTGIPVWFRNDLIIGLAASIAIRFFIKCQYRINFAEKSINQEFTNPFYYKKRKIEFSEIALITTICKISGWPLLWHLYRFEYSVAMILKDGTTLPLPRIVTDKTCRFSNQAEADAQAAHLAGFLGCDFQTGLFSNGQSFKQWCSDADLIAESSGAQPLLKEAIWKARLSNVFLEYLEPGIIKVDLPTMKEKFILFLLTLLSIASTYWVVNSEATYIAANPRLIYLFLLDSTSVLVTLYSAWLWLIDEYYIFDVNKRLVIFRSRFLFWKKETLICDFDQIDCFDVYNYRGWYSTVFEKDNVTLIKYSTRLKNRDGKYYLMSDDIHGNSLVPTLRGNALSKLVFSCDSPAE